MIGLVIYCTCFVSACNRGVCNSWCRTHSRAVVKLVGEWMSMQQNTVQELSQSCRGRGNEYILLGAYMPPKAAT